MNTWSIVTTVKAPIEMINIFIKEHLKLKPKEIFIFLDSPADFKEDNIFRKNDNVFIISCDKEFWKSREHFHVLRYKKGERPESVEYRQYHNMLHAQSISQANWLIGLDVDEIIYSENNITDILAEYPPNVFSVRVAPVEAIYKNNPPLNIEQVFSTNYFKSRFKAKVKIWDEIYPNPMINHKTGFFGHVVGKSFFRVNEEIRTPSCHISKPLDQELAHGVECQDILIKHFEAMTPALFTEKNLKRINKEFYVPLLDQRSKDRIDYLSKIYNEKGETVFKEIYNEMHVINQNKIDILKDRKCIIDLNDYAPPKKEYVKNNFNSILCVNLEKYIIQAIDFNTINFENHIPVSLSFMYKRNGGEQKAYFSFKNKNKNFYLYVDRFDSLRISKKNKAQLLTLEGNNNRIFNLSLNGKYLRSQPNGIVKMDTEKPLAWEEYKFTQL